MVATTSSSFSSHGQSRKCHMRTIIIPEEQNDDIMLTSQRSPPSAPSPSSYYYYYNSGDPWSEENLHYIINLWELNEEDKERLIELGQNLRDIQHFKNDPHIVLRYMRSPCGYKGTEQAFRKMIQWRIENDIDRLLDEYKPPQTLLDYSPTAFLKDYDRDGDPIYIERGGALDGLGLIKRYPKDQLMKHAIWLREVQCSGAWIHEYERRQGRKIRDITVVYDLQGLSSRHLDPRVLDWFKSHMKITTDYYPGPVKRVIVIRAPSIFRVMWSLAKHVFNREAQEKMIFTSNSNYLEVLNEYIDLNVLPSCIYPQGQGEPAIGMPQNLEGGRIPDHIGCGYIPNNSVLSTTDETTKWPSTASVESTSEDDEVLDDDGSSNSNSRLIVRQVSSDLSVRGGVLVSGKLVKNSQGHPNVVRIKNKSSA